MGDFLPNTDNFFKYLLTIGILMISFAIVYPVEREKEIDLQIISFKNDTAVLNFEIWLLSRKHNELSEKKMEIQKILDELKKQMQNRPESQRAEIQKHREGIVDDFNREKTILIGVADSLNFRQLYLRNTVERISRLDSYLDTFRNYKIGFIICGIILSIIGLRYWSASVYMEELESGNNINNHYKTAFVRHVNFFVKVFKNRLARCVILIISMLLLAVCFLLLAVY